MRTRLLLFMLFACTLVLAPRTLASSGFTSGNNQPHMVSLDSRTPSLDVGGERRAGSGLVREQLSLGYLQGPGILLETSSYDFQHISRMARQIAVGSDGRVHFVWTYLPVGGSPTNRAIHYRSFKNVGAGGTMTTIRDISGDLARTPGGFSAIDVSNNRALIAFHYGTGPLTTIALDAASGAGSFSVEDTPSGVINAEGIACGDGFVNNYIWPVVATEAGSGGNLIVHVLTQEGKTGGQFSAMTYFRGVSSSTSLESGMFGTSGRFIDSVSATAYDIVSDPNSDKVAVVYPIPRQANRENNDLGYRMSTDQGVTWGPRVNITNFPSDSTERCGQEVSAIFGADGCLHMLWIGTIYDSVANAVSDQQCRLYHWSSCNPTCQSLVTAANNSDFDCNTASNEYNISRISLSQCVDTTSSPDDTMLYAVYIRQLGDGYDSDCSQSGYFNGELFASASSTWGETWGAPTNLSFTRTDQCPPGFCEDESFSSAARYCVDSLRIEFMEDLDAGNFHGDESSTTETSNPVRFLSRRCVAMQPYQELSCTPSAIKYPFHATVGNTASATLLLRNAGNQSVNWTSSILPGATTTVSLSGSGTVQAGCTNSADVTVTVGPNGSEGLFHATIRFTYQGGAKNLDVPVDFYVFNSWFLEEDVSLRTAYARLKVSQVGRVAHQDPANGLYTFLDGQSYLFDGSLIIGNSANNLNFLAFEGPGIEPTPENPWRPLYALSHTTCDSTSFPSYRYAEGIGCIADSTVAYKIRYFFPKHVDSADFGIAAIELFPGPNYTSPVTGLDVGFILDFDLPQDSVDESPGGKGPSGTKGRKDVPNAFIEGAYKGEFVTDTRSTRLEVAGSLSPSGFSGGFHIDNTEYVYPHRTLDAQKTYQELDVCAGVEFPVSTDAKDNSIVVKGYAKARVDQSGTKVEAGIYVGGSCSFKQRGLSPEAAARQICEKAFKFACDHVYPEASYCQSCTDCGDANSDGAIDISDAVFLIAHIFSGGVAPGDCNYPKGMGDANGDGTVDISDAVYLIARIFSGGPPPHCYGT